jgi:iron complex transport system substrate-binding protein
VTAASAGSLAWRGDGDAGLTGGKGGAEREKPARIPRRIGSLLPAATEIVCALGLGDRLVLRSHECDYPPWVAKLPYATVPQVDPSRGSGSIDRDIQALIRKGLSVYEVDEHALKRAGPQVIITQDQCQVCAVPFERIQDAVERFLDPATRVLSLSPTDLDAVLDDMARAARVLGVPQRGEALVHQLRHQLDELAARVRRERAGPPSRVVTLEWLDPVMVGGNWMPELVAMAGGENLLGTPGRHSPVVEWEEVRQLDPDVLVVVPCGFTLDRTRKEAQEILPRLPGWAQLSAVQSGRVALVDGHHYFNRPGPRIVESLETLAQILHGWPREEGDREGEGDRSAPTRWEWMDEAGQK